MAKSVSKKFENIMDHPIVKIITDRKADITPVLETVSGWWSYDLYNRKPGPAYTDDGVFIGTDLDLACFLFELSKRGAAINIPKYETFRQTKLKEGQFLTSKDNRHGILKGLISNREFWIFSISVNDLGIITEQGAGDTRTFSMTDFKGKWYKGWDEMQFVATADENKWMTEHKLFTDNRIVFKHFIHPNRWTSFFGEKYFITKLLLQRLEQESKYYFGQVKQMKEKGITFPKGSGPSKSKSYSDKSVDKGKQIQMEAFEVEIDVPPNDITFPEYDFNQKNLVKLHNSRNNYIFGVGPALRFMTRATEYAHFINPDRFPAWVKGAEWIQGYKQKGKKKEWSRLILCQPENFKLGVALRKRSWMKSTRVSESYEEA